MVVLPTSTTQEIMKKKMNTHQLKRYSDGWYNALIEKTKKLLADDKKRLGTAEYRGHAYFWHYEFRHQLRSFDPEPGYKIPWAAVRQMRRTVHNQFRKHKMQLNGYSAQHSDIINKAWAVMAAKKTRLK